MNIKLIGFDTETTGINVREDRIIQSSLITREVVFKDDLKKEVVEIKDSIDEIYINPGVPIPESATAVHKITNEMIAAIGKDAKESLDLIAEKIANSAREGTALVIYNANYDLSILKHELIRHGLKTVEERLGLKEGEHFKNVVDPYCIDRICDKYRKGQRRLVDLIDAYSIGGKQDAESSADDLHNATVDTAFTLDLLLAIFAKFPEISKMSLSELFDYQQSGYRKWAKDRNEWARKNSKNEVSLEWLG